MRAMCTANWAALSETRGYMSATIPAESLRKPKGLLLVRRFGWIWISWGSHAGWQIRV